MSSKKQEKEAARRNAHKAALRAAKRRRRQAGVEDPIAVAIREERQKILIVCEGVNTEPSYFSHFKAPNADIEIVGEGKNTKSLVKSARKLVHQAKEPYDQIWIVMDKDDFPAENFDNAIMMAEADGFHVAYANQAFEYWLLLHFEAHNGGGMHRKRCLEKFNQHIAGFGLKYDPDSKYISEEIFELLLAKSEKSANAKNFQQLAIGRADKILTYHEGKARSAAESSTTIQNLVRELNKPI